MVVAAGYRRASSPTTLPNPDGRVRAGRTSWTAPGAYRVSKRLPWVDTVPMREGRRFTGSGD